MVELLRPPAAAGCDDEDAALTGLPVPSHAVPLGRALSAGLDLRQHVDRPIGPRHALAGPTDRPVREQRPSGCVAPVKGSCEVVETGTGSSIAELARLHEAGEAALPHAHDLEPVLDGLSRGRVQAQPEQRGYAKESKPTHAPHERLPAFRPEPGPVVTERS